MQQPKPYHFQVFNKEHWADLVTLFGPEGASEGCWCMSHRSKQSIHGEEAKTALFELVQQDRIQGILAYHKQAPIAWLSFGPREEFFHIEYHPDFRKSRDSSPGALYAIPCFFVSADYRGQGLAKQLLSFALSHLQGLGITEIEGYPVKSSVDDRQTIEDWAFMGSQKLFEQAGFQAKYDCQYEQQCMGLSFEV